MKAYTDIPQSAKLAEILPIESADMWYSYYGHPGYNPVIAYKGEQWFLCQIRNSLHNDIPCWSLAALLGVLPILERKGYQKAKPRLLYNVAINKWIVDSHIYTTDAYDNPVDTCVDMILLLKEKNLI